MAGVNMIVVNTSVYCEQSKQTIMPWTILDLREESYSFNDFFSEVIMPKLSHRHCRLLSAHIGPDKFSLDPVDVTLTVITVVVSFGRFVKYYVESYDVPITSDEVIGQGASAQALFGAHDSQPLAFVEQINVRNRKDKLYNDLIEFFISRKALLSESEVCEEGKMLVTTLRDVLWYIDGYHSVLATRAIAVPELFREFVYYNVPEMSKHRKRRTANISSDQLSSFAQNLCTILHHKYWDRPIWKEIKPSIITLCESLSSYVEYLTLKNKKAKVNHLSAVPVREVGENLRIKFLPAADFNDIHPSLLFINDIIQQKPEYEFISLSDHLPLDAVQRHRFIHSLEASGLSSSSILLVYSPGGNVGNLQFLWKVPDSNQVERCFEQSQTVIESIKKHIPVYHTRAMKRAMFEKFGRVTSSLKPAILRYFYRDLTGDQSAADTTQQSYIDQQIRQMIDMEDVSVVADLRSHNQGQSHKFEYFWSECEKFINEDIGRAVDDRRHGSVTHMARAISIRDLKEQVQARCPVGTPIPCEEWIRLQFWPKTPSAKSLHYTGRFKVKFQIQQRQWRHFHVDAHYAAAYFRYMREYAVSIREHCCFYSIDDKHKVHVGEPDCPVAAVERGRRVLVRSDESFVVADHDYTKFGVIPSVIFSIDIPEEVSGSWYHGRVFVGLKESIFEPSSPMRHICELYSVIHDESTIGPSLKPVVFIYSDGGPDHRLTYVSVQLSLVCLFLKLDLDYLCACRTAPYHSWRNPVERVMSILNLGLQCVGLARTKMPDKFEDEVKKCNNLSQLRAIAVKFSNFPIEVQNSLTPVKMLLTNIFSRLKLHDETIRTFKSATPDEISDFWTTLIALDCTLREDIQYTKKKLSNHVNFVRFLDHCCHASHYCFDILKCGSTSCNICKPTQLPYEIFSKLRHLPHPMPGNDEHYRAFSDVFGDNTVTEDYRPSKKKQTSSRGKSLSFYASVQHVKNSELLVLCEECQMWRIIYSKYKLTKEQRITLQRILDDFIYTCGSKLHDLHLPEEFNNVEVKDHLCYDHIEKLYYSAKLSPICIFCGRDQPYTCENTYPQCSECAHREPIYKK